MVNVTNCGKRLQLLEVTFSDKLIANCYCNHLIGLFFTIAAALTLLDFVTVTLMVTISAYSHCYHLRLL